MLAKYKVYTASVYESEFLNIKNFKINKNQKIFCQYEFFGDSDISRTQMGEDMSKINFQKLIGYEKVDERV